jgi:hypothetical protein
MRVDIISISLFPPNDALKYTRTLDFMLRVYGIGLESYSAGDLKELYNKGIQSLLTKLPLLEKSPYIMPIFDVSNADQLCSQAERRSFVLIYHNTFTQEVPRYWVIGSSSPRGD